MAAEPRERYAKKNEAQELRRAFDRLDFKGDGKVDAEELGMFFKQMGHRAKKSEVADMIWEIDDKFVSWPEFQAMYQRCRKDKTGYEPRRLFNVVEFIINDKDNSGTVSVEEAMQILYVRYGKACLDSQLQEIFGTSDTNSTKTLTLSEYLSSLYESQIKMLRAKINSKGYEAPQPGSTRSSGL
ncbi:Outer dynein arm docking complex 3 [Cymbomonas tetramitiformis]|uniref:Outer dynein arm docking complex 3 n=1 Tax=Cymbomonas tetramitiformis TaxID=36881 RepID=A0AAE0L6B7_9CHLO|nr:Outer dynein arm docking complex 3 [Cymbomonas tetramitiformis]